jgi:hypothetical protein
VRRIHGEEDAEENIWIFQRGSNREIRIGELHNLFSSPDVIRTRRWSMRRLEYVGDAKYEKSMCHCSWKT